MTIDMTERVQPTSIQHIGDELAISWNDGAETFLRLTDLRRACPCAVCGGEPDVLGNIDRPDVTYTTLPQARIDLAQSVAFSRSSAAAK